MIQSELCFSLPKNVFRFNCHSTWSPLWGSIGTWKLITTSFSSESSKLFPPNPQTTPPSAPSCKSVQVTFLSTVWKVNPLPDAVITTELHNDNYLQAMQSEWLCSLVGQTLALTIVARFCLLNGARSDPDSWQFSSINRVNGQCPPIRVRYPFSD